MKIAALFPGQGSQAVGMGKSFFDSSEVAKEVFAIADQSLGFKISSLCFDGPLEKLTLTENAQPAILTTSYICWQMSGAPEVVAAAGHSLGEYTALVAAEVIGFIDAVQLVNKRGRYMQEAVRPGAGKMVAVMGPTEEEIRSVLPEVRAGVAEIANLNSPGQTVVAGDVSGIDQFSELMKAKGGKIIPLNVSAPFHCSLMKPAAEKLAKDLDAITFSEPRFPVYANFSATAVSSGKEARELLKKQVCGSVRWTDSMQRLIKETGATQAIEFGPGGVLSKLLKRIDKSVPATEIADPAAVAAARGTVLN